MKTKLAIGLFFVAAFGFVASNVQAQDAGVAPASQAVPSDPCSECEGGIGGIGGLGVGLPAFGGFGGFGLPGGALNERIKAARAADHPIVEASPFANPNGSLQDWNRFRYYPYGYYPHNFSANPNMSVPKYHPGYQNYYPVPRRFHEGHHFHLDVF